MASISEVIHVMPIFIAYSFSPYSGFDPRAAHRVTVTFQSDGLSDRLMNTRWNIDIFAGSLLLVLSSAPLMAGGGVTFSHTNGSDAYTSNTVDGNVDLSAKTYLGATYNTYHSDDSNGTINTYYLRLGHVATNSSVRLFGSYTPEVNDYKYTSGGFDFRTTLFGRKSDDEMEKGSSADKKSAEDESAQGSNAGAETVSPSGPPAWHADPHFDFLGGYTRYMYQDQGEDINENDITGGVGFGLYKTYLSGTFTKSVYDEEISSLVNLNQRKFSVAYAPTIIPGYPDYFYSANIDQTLWPGWWLLGSYSRLKLKASPDDLANLYTAGIGVRLFNHLLGSVLYTLYAPTGDNSDIKRNYFSVGGGWQF